MEKRLKQGWEMCERVLDFLGVYPPPATAAYAVQKQVLDGVAERLGVHFQDQSISDRLSQQETRRMAALRKQLRSEFLAPLAQIARAHREVPGIERAMKTPSGNLSTAGLIQEAAGIRGAVAVQPAVFIESGQPEDFLVRLDAAIEALRQSFLGRARTVGTRVGAGRGFQDEIRALRKSVDIIDTIVRAAFRGRRDVLAKWRQAKRIRLSGTQSTTQPTTEPATQPVAPTKEAA